MYKLENRVSSDLPSQEGVHVCKCRGRWAELLACTAGQQIPSLKWADGNVNETKEQSHAGLSILPFDQDNVRELANRVEGIGLRRRYSKGLRATLKWWRQVSFFQAICSQGWMNELGLRSHPISNRASSFGDDWGGSKKPTGLSLSLSKVAGDEDSAIFNVEKPSHKVLNFIFHTNPALKLNFCDFYRLLGNLQSMEIGVKRWATNVGIEIAQLKALLNL